METKDWIDMLLSIVSGIAVCIPLVAALVRYVRKAIQEKNWTQLLNLVVHFMKAAETMFDTGTDRKQYVMQMVQDSAQQIAFDIDMALVSRMIDDLCSMSKVVNPPVSPALEAEEVSA